jgi:hypothetical protein
LTYQSILYRYRSKNIQIQRYQNLLIWQQFDAITINSKELELVSSAKVLGVIISSSLQWVDHVNEVINKANKRLYFLILLKRATSLLVILSIFTALLLDRFSSIVLLFSIMLSLYTYVMTLSAFKSVRCP